MEDRELVERLTKVEERSKVNSHRIEEVEKTTKAIHDMNTTMNGILIEMQHMREDNKKSTNDLDKKIESVNGKVDTLSEKIDVIEDKPNNEKAEKWDKVKWEVFMFIILGIVAYLCGTVFPFFK